MVFAGGISGYGMEITAREERENFVIVIVGVNYYCCFAFVGLCDHSIIVSDFLSDLF
jgi:hypothetical protein